MPKSGTEFVVLQDTETEIFNSSDPGVGVTPEMAIGHHPSSNAVAVAVRVNPLHGSNESFTLYKGASQSFKCQGGIKRITVTALAGDGIVDWAPTEDIEYV